jgi:biopolymer transport protein TolR
MASVGGHSSGRSKSLDAEINLVPFIDLLSMCICFLLMTAVWIQIAAIEVKQSHGNQAKTTQALYDLDLRFVGPTAVEVKLQKENKILKKDAFQAASLSDLVASLETTLKGWPIQAPSENSLKSSLISAAMVTPAIGVPYGNMIAVVDALRRQGIVNLGIVPVRGTP